MKYLENFKHLDSPNIKILLLNTISELGTGVTIIEAVDAINHRFIENKSNNRLLSMQALDAIEALETEGMIASDSDEFEIYLYTVDEAHSPT